jgi:O-acetyl-ADP-ribose deacetylase (regulator of RNase III)
MIKYLKGISLEADTQALVNTVNTVGVMGKGIALQFKERFPLNYKLYAEACKERRGCYWKNVCSKGKTLLKEKRS